MIVGSLKVQNGIKNLWKQGPSEGFEPHANFGQFIPINYFECFAAGFPYLWCDEKYWYTDPKSLPWEVILPFFDDYNTKRNTLLAVVYLVLDESMSGWRPKTSKTGGLPNISYEPRKPVELGTMARDAAECTSGVMAFLDIVQDIVNQRRKKYTGDPSHMPKGENVYVHVAETLRQAEGAGLKKGGWLCGDAWFGSIPCSVELMRRLGVHSTFVIKQNTQYYPMEVLNAILRARFPSSAAGHWVVMKATISEVDLFVMAYAWSARGVSYIVSTCGTTVQHEIPYVSRFEDEFGHTSTKDLARPSIAHIMFEYLPLIDEHNKARQNVLALEKCWPTKFGFFRVVTTAIGMCVVDLQVRLLLSNIKSASSLLP